MNRNDTERALRKFSLVLAKGLVDSHGHEQIVCNGRTAEDILRETRNTIWDKYGPEELETLEAEIDLGL